MDFLVCSRATSAAMVAPDNPELDERHWSYMDAYADALTARGPTLGVDRCTWTGSIHVVDLPGPDAAREFVDGEPYHQAGAYERHFIWRFTNVLGRTMWEFAGAPGELRFFVLAHAAPDRPNHPDAVPLADIDQHVREGLIVYGRLHDPYGVAPAGVALAVQVPTRQALDTLLGDGLAWLGSYGDIEVHDWEFGGRR
ncbi:MAG TPA: YciI family protein [Jatrophihabitans sp.]|nr:YciI family protein [Jatrophihabitans sp.]